MSVYQFTLAIVTGKKLTEHTGIIVAENECDAVLKLQKKNQYVIELHLATQTDLMIYRLKNLKKSLEVSPIEMKSTQTKKKNWLPVIVGSIIGILIILEIIHVYYI